jgi:hypothetical protein
MAAAGMAPGWAAMAAMASPPLPESSMMRLAREAAALRCLLLLLSCRTSAGMACRTAAQWRRVCVSAGSGAGGRAGRQHGLWHSGAHTSVPGMAGRVLWSVAQYCCLRLGLGSRLGWELITLQPRGVQGRGRGAETVL